MRLWSIHPKYLDGKGLVAVWREGLLAQKVLKGQTKGYKKHPQLFRFTNHPSPMLAITCYLHYLVDEADFRNYKFNRGKLGLRCEVEKINVTEGQLAYELKHLKNKLAIRDLNKLSEINLMKQLEPHPLFRVVPGEIESWEK